MNNNFLHPNQTKGKIKPKKELQVIESSQGIHSNSQAYKPVSEIPHCPIKEDPNYLSVLTENTRSDYQHRLRNPRKTL